MQRLNQILMFFWLTVGALIGAFAVVVFLAPFDVAPTGVAGVAVILNKLINTPIGIMIFILNIPIQILAYRMLPGGWQVIARTLYVLVVYTVSIDFFSQYVPVTGLSDDRLLNALFGGVLGGISGGLVFRQGGTFGGTSTLALILQRRTGTPMSTTYLYTDTAVIVWAGFVFGLEGALYAFVVLFVGGLATDYVMEGPSIIRTAVIITDKPDVVAQAVFEKLQRGATGLPARGMYTGAERTMLYVTVSRAQVPDLRRVVSQADQNAFMVIGHGHAADARGFKPMISE